MNWEEMSRREKIKAVIADFVGELTYYGRREDEDLPVGSIEDAVEAGELTLADMCESFADALGRCDALSQAEAKRLTAELPHPHKLTPSEWAEQLRRRG